MAATAAGLAAIVGCVRPAAHQETDTDEGERPGSRENTALIDYGHRLLLSLMQIQKIVSNPN